MNIEIDSPGIANPSVKRTDSHPESASIVFPFLLVVGLESSYVTELIGFHKMLMGIEIYGVTWLSLRLVGVVALFAVSLFAKNLELRNKTLDNCIRFLFFITALVCIQDLLAGCWERHYIYELLSPLAFFLAICCYIGYSPRFMALVERLLVINSIITLFFVGYYVFLTADLSLTALGRNEYIKILAQVIVAQMITLGYLISRANEKKQKMQMFFWQFYGIGLLFLFLYCAARSWLVQLAVIFCLFFRKRFFTMVVFWALILIVNNVILSSDFYNVISNYWEQDSRSDEYVQFFQSINLSRFFSMGFGLGGEWSYLDTPRRGVDGAGINLIFWGGLGLLFSYLCVIYIPLLQVRHRCKELFWDNLSAFTPLILWGLVLIGMSVYTGCYFSYYHILIYIIAGRGWYIASQKTPGAAGKNDSGMP